MSHNAMWKAMHLLYLYQNGPKGLTFSDLTAAGIDCYADTVRSIHVEPPMGYGLRQPWPHANLAGAAHTAWLHPVPRS